MNGHESNFVAAFTGFQYQAYKCSKDHGFHETPLNFGEKIALMHAELSEALEYNRKSDGKNASDHIPPFTGVEEEFADVIIRIMDTAEALKLDVASAIIAKMKFNDSRPYKHGKKF